MKRTISFALILMLMAVMLAACSAGSAENAQFTGEYLPEGAEFIRTERDDGFTEHKYRDADGQYTLLVDGNENVRALEYDAAARSTADTVALTADEAFAKLTEAYPEAVLIAAVEDRDDGRYEQDLLVSVGDDLGFFELDAATGDILDYEIFYGLGATLDLSAILESNLANASVVELNLDADDGRLYLDGEARTDNGRMEFTIDAESGILVEAEYDD